MGHYGLLGALRVADRVAACMEVAARDVARRIDNPSVVFASSSRGQYPRAFMGHDGRREGRA